MHAPLNDAASALLRAIRDALESVATFAIEEIRSRGWASVTFTGARHELAFRIEGDEADRAADHFLSGLEAAEFSLRGHILADIALVAQERRPGFARLRLEALTVEDD